MRKLRYRIDVEINNLLTKELTDEVESQQRRLFMMLTDLRYVFDIYVYIVDKYLRSMWTRFGYCYIFLMRSSVYKLECSRTKWI